jgi:Ni/Fe-hydrogenase subunit HybB-like protein
MTMNRRLVVLKTVLWALVGVLAAITVVRFTRGLGAVTNLSDAAPWGLWVAFDVMAGVALAAGGFVVAATVYIFGLDKYRGFVRPAILTAWLGYIAVAVGLLYDLGLPWHIWHPAIYPQHHSVLFEVAMCVMLYLAVLTLEFAPVVLEHPLFAHPLYKKVLKIVKTVTIPLVIAGIVLSTLHQSSLGSLFLITPYRLHPLWYSPIIYVLFFVSAVALGLMTVMVESLLAGYFLGHKIRTKLLSGLGVAASGVLGLYAALRIGDLAVRGVLSTALDGSWQGALFAFELAVSTIIPFALLLSNRVRSSIAGLALCSGLTVAGMILYRLDVCFIAIARPAGTSYFPSWMEFAVSLGIVAAGTLVFLLLVERFKVYDHEDVAPAGLTPSYEAGTLRGLLPGAMAFPRRYSLVAVTAAAVTVLFLPIGPVRPESTPVAAPRTIDGVSFERDDGLGSKLMFASAATLAATSPDSRPLLMIDGNRDGTLVLFDHDGHAEREGGDASCSTCHHLNKPLDRNSSCNECHRDMYESTRLFNHESHVSELGGDEGCSECHTDSQAVKSFETATACSDCHEVETPSDSLIKLPDNRWGDAVSYVDAMHDACVVCHERRLTQPLAQYAADLDQCSYCHDTNRSARLADLVPRRQSRSTLAGGHR